MDRTYKILLNYCIFTMVRFIPMMFPWHISARSQYRSTPSHVVDRPLRGRFKNGWRLKPRCTVFYEHERTDPWTDRHRTSRVGDCDSAN